MRADPFTGEPDVIRRVAAGLADDADDVLRGGVQLDTVVGLLEHDWEGAAGRQFVRLATSLAPGARRTACCMHEAAETLGDYAAEVAAIHDEARALRALAVDHDGALAAHAVAMRIATGATARADAVEADHLRVRRLQDDGVVLADRGALLDERWSELEARRARADRRAAERLQSDDVVGRAPALRSNAASMSDASVLAALAALPPEQLAGLGDDDALLLRLAAMPAPLVAEWWDRLGGAGSAAEHTASQAAFIAAFPSVIGNLDGVAYWARDLANRTVLGRDLDDVTARVTLLQERYRSAAPAERTAALAELAEALRRWSKLDNLAAGLRKRYARLPEHPVQLVSYRPGSPPLGAVAIGDVDSAEHVTWFVPGMGSSLSDTTHYMRANANLLVELGSRETTSTAAVVWLGYEAPPAMAADVLFQRHAATGARALVADLEAYRCRNESSRVDVIGHSYGSTLASIALATGDVRVRAFVALGSAGIPVSIPDVAHLAADRVFAAQGDEGIAGLGRSLSGRRDPLAIGASPLSTEAEGDLAGVNAHGVLVHDDGAHRTDHGYLDEGTRSLAAVAEALT